MTIEKCGYQVVDMGPRNWLYEDGRNDYSLEGLEKADTVIDIGMCFGSFQLMLKDAGFNKRIIAVEPLWFDIAQQTIELNNLTVAFVHAAIGATSDEWVLVNFQGRELYAPTIAMEEILEKAAGKIFLKCDCECGEWHLKPEHFKNIIRAEMELHELDGIKADRGLIQFLEREYYTEIGGEILTPQGRALICHFYRKAEFPTKKEQCGPVERYFFS